MRNVTAEEVKAAMIAAGIDEVNEGRNDHLIRRGDRLFHGRVQGWECGWEQAAMWINGVADTLARERAALFGLTIDEQPARAMRNVTADEAVASAQERQLDARQIEAWEKVVGALKFLSKERQARVLKSAAALFDIKLELGE